MTDTKPLDVSDRYEPAVALDHLVPDPDNRKPVLNKEFISNIAELGVLTPIIARPDELDQELFHVIAGHRRLAAARKAKLLTVPVIIKSGLTERQRLTLQATENLHRLDLDHVEAAQILARLVATDTTVADIAKDLGKSKKWVTQRLAIMELPETESRLVADGTWPLEAAVAAAKLLNDPDVYAAFLKATPSRSTYTTWASLASQCKSEVEVKRTITATRADIKAKHQGDGIKVKFVSGEVRNPIPQYYGPGALSSMAALGTTAAKHRGEPCHVWSVRRRYSHTDTVDTAEGCKDWTRHMPDGESKLKIPKAKQPKRINGRGDEPPAGWVEAFDDLMAAVRDAANVPQATAAVVGYVANIAMTRDNQTQARIEYLTGGEITDVDPVAIAEAEHPHTKDTDVWNVRQNRRGTRVRVADETLTKWMLESDGNPALLAYRSQVGEMVQAVKRGLPPAQQFLNTLNILGVKIPEAIAAEFEPDPDDDM